MILTALQLEMRNLLRSPLRFITLFLVLGAGVFVLVQGKQDIVHWKNTISEGEKAQEAFGRKEVSF